MQELLPEYELDLGEFRVECSLPQWEFQKTCHHTNNRIRIKVKSELVICPLEVDFSERKRMNQSLSQIEVAEQDCGVIDKFAATQTSVHS